MNNFTSKVQYFTKGLQSLEVRMDARTAVYLSIIKVYGHAVWNRRPLVQAGDRRCPRWGHHPWYPEKIHLNPSRWPLPGWGREAHVARNSIRPSPRASHVPPLSAGGLVGGQCSVVPNPGLGTELSLGLTELLGLAGARRSCIAS